jgi:NAD(P)-dependent dehydrogenase (short-subunit alcohol dehydrogenase family)
MLYAKNAKVYVAARSEEKARNAMDSIKATVTGTTTGHLEYLHLDLADLTTIKPTVQNFLSKESQLHVLINNAGVAFPGQGTKTAQGYELQLGVNCLGPFLLTKLLSPTIVSTAKASPPDTVRVVWTASSAAEGTSPKGYMDNLDYHKDEGSFKKYSVSKMGNYFHSSEYAQRYSADGIASVSLNPGNLDTDLWRTQSPLTAWILRKTVFYPIVYGAYTTVFAAFSPLVQVSKDGTYGMCFKLTHGFDDGNLIFFGSRSLGKSMADRSLGEGRREAQGRWWCRNSTAVLGLVRGAG